MSGVPIAKAKRGKGPRGKRELRLGRTRHEMTRRALRDAARARAAGRVELPWPLQ